VKGPQFSQEITNGRIALFRGGSFSGFELCQSDYPSVRSQVLIDLLGLSSGLILVSGA
jgi:hypothetical protein